jgi:GxxExxY protein
MTSALAFFSAHLFLPSCFPYSKFFDNIHAIMELKLEKLTEKIIGAAIIVHKELGPGFLESIYENSLKIMLRELEIEAEFQKEVPIHFHSMLVGMHRLDALVCGELVLELKAIKTLEDIHFAQVRSYLRATGLNHGLLLNFATMPLTIKRVIAPLHSQ